MKPRKKSAEIILLITLILLFCFFHTGCQYAAPLALTSTSMGIAYYYTNVAEKTCCFDLDRMTRATLQALRKMGFSICDQSMTEGERMIRIKAETENLDIIIKLKKVTSKCTKIKVKVREGAKMDKATGIEIVCQIEEAAKGLTYTIGGYSFEVAMAPLSWSLTHEEIESIDGLPPKEAIRQCRVNKSPYVASGKEYIPISVDEARTYRETGIASWYGPKAMGKDGAYMTANGEVFDPNGLSAAHQYLPLPTYVRVTNLENKRSIIVRVNNRGPFVNGRIIDLSAAAARKLGFYEEGITEVLIEALKVEH